MTLIDHARKGLNRIGFDVVRSGYWNRFLDVDVLIDAGAASGETYQRFRDLGFMGKIFSFEPDAESFRKLEMKNGFGWIKLNAALGDDNELHIFNGGLGQQSSFYKNCKSGLISSLKTHRLDSIFKEPCKSILLKTDCEGYDLKVVQGASGLFHKIKYVLMEVPFKERYKGEPVFVEIISRMKDCGFAPVWVVKNYFLNGVPDYVDLLFGKI